MSPRVEQKNDLDGAYKALSMVREKSPDKPEEVLLNLAHVELAMVRYYHITTPLHLCIQSSGSGSTP